VRIGKVKDAFLGRLRRKPDGVEAGRDRNVS
jgi:hypothetical protein